MALMFPRLARNFARNGYYPTDETTLERTLQALAPSPTGKMRIFDPCAGEGLPWPKPPIFLGGTAQTLSRLNTTKNVPSIAERCWIACCTATSWTP